MARKSGHHRISRRTKVATAGLGLVLAIGGTVVITTAGEPGQARADLADKSFFVDITTVQPNVDPPRQQDDASTGTFTVDCGRNENGHFNPDNFIAQPGVRNGAQHLHDYVGNLTTDADSTNESLQAGGTTCKNGDKSTYFWPVVRIEEAEDEQQDNNDDQNQEERNENGGNAGQDNAGQRDGQRADGRDQRQNNQQDNNNQQGGDEQDGNEEEPPELEAPNEQNELAGNDGEIQRPAEVDLTFRGSPAGDVVAMPKFLRILYGDAKVSANGTKNARNSWTCQGFEDRVLINKYPICPNGAPVKRIHDFPSCWDGENIDSENHRDHIVYPNPNGQCPDGFQAVPQLRITLTYDIPQEVQEQGRYKVDSFPEEEHNPFSDHDDFANVMSDQIMNRVVDCVNQGRTCNE
ncbi:DUF1996 domain-containing protein [Kibdelosporangium persicum]|uniref:DUF1996 domain-containing protein n=1 Tax=Kibdelosporangium persicum TaxID=2698649 RepID=A0ABX2EY47_9PSEU|nr:DUF1996 domain-containing protein [Kibdelosporangium persicum]NRN63613.1 hypothetical protein [Kibdelosporangium persicum]